jgi:hypothetical protein
LIAFTPSLAQEIDEIAWQRRNRSFSDMTRKLLMERIEQIKVEQREREKVAI